mmetsp:Transcript_22245/g.39139  ORF Transcript_22245/g.39139 Transcript_22245/m.39139 type:complete len:200 (+) Transcript_22245:2139-2738(+)
MLRRRLLLLLLGWWWLRRRRLVTISPWRSRSRTDTTRRRTHIRIRSRIRITRRSPRINFQITVFTFPGVTGNFKTLFVIGSRTLRANECFVAIVLVAYGTLVKVPVHGHFKLLLIFLFFDLQSNRIGIFYGEGTVGGKHLIQIVQYRWVQVLGTIHLLWKFGRRDFQHWHWHGWFQFLFLFGPCIGWFICHWRRRSCRP